MPFGAFLYCLGSKSVFWIFVADRIAPVYDERQIRLFSHEEETGEKFGTGLYILV